MIGIKHIQICYLIFQTHGALWQNWPCSKFNCKKARDIFVIIFLYYLNIVFPLPYPLLHSFLTLVIFALTMGPANHLISQNIPGAIQNILVNSWLPHNEL